jgi:hypothetical protein
MDKPERYGAGIFVMVTAPFFCDQQKAHYYREVPPSVPPQGNDIPTPQA